MAQVSNLKSPAYDVMTKLDTTEFIDRMIGYMEEIDMQVFAFGAEGGVGQFEIDFYYGTFLEMADRLTLFKMMRSEERRVGKERRWGREEECGREKGAR